MGRESGAKRTTLYDVAKRAGVSYQTVSRVINNSPNVATKTRDRVLRAIRDLGYRPNQAARSLNTHRSYVLQIITFHVGHNQAVEAMLYTAKQLGYHMAFSAVWDLSSDKEIRDQLDGLAARLIDGLVMITPSINFSYDELATLCRGIPFVLVGAEPGIRAPSVIIDQRGGTHMAVDHLLRLGHTRIAEITGDMQYSDARVRHEAYCEAMRNAGLEPDLWVEGSFLGSGGYRGVQQLLDRGAEFTALVCGNDEAALGAMLALHERGLRVPEDVSVVGFDDTRAAAFYNPPLTTVRQDFWAMGKEAVEYLVALINDPNTSVHQRILYPRLVVRRSTGRVR